VASALDVVVHMARLPDGRRVLLDISAVEGLEQGEPILVPIFSLSRAQGLRGGFVASGHVPGFTSIAASRGEPLDESLFRPGADEWSPQQVTPGTGLRTDGLKPLARPSGEFIPETAFALGVDS
jgi:hypothetical protein